MHTLLKSSSGARWPLARSVLPIAIAAALSAGAPAHASAVSDALLAIETNRVNIVEGIVERFGASLGALGVPEAQLRQHLLGLRADQLLAAGLVRDLRALDLARPAGADPLQQYVAIEPTALDKVQPIEVALAYVVRRGGALAVLGPAEFDAQRAAGNGADQVVGWFVDAALIKRVTTLLGEAARGSAGAASGDAIKGSTPAAGNWLGYTGGGNTVSGTGSGVMAGTANAAGAGNAAVVAGSSNSASADSAAVVAGTRNMAGGANAIVGAGAGNLAAGDLSFIGGGGRDDGTTLPAGSNARDNRAYGKWAAIGGGYGNQAGVFNQAQASRGTAVLGGNRNAASGVYSAVGGGGCNVASGPRSAVLGGGQSDDAQACGDANEGNQAQGELSAIVGGRTNYATSIGAFIGGGKMNLAGGSYSVVGGGDSNTGNGAGAVIGGGALNAAGGTNATVAGGTQNSASNSSATIGGGANNTASGDASVVAGGRQNLASGGGAVVLGGSYGSASGMGAFVGGGAGGLAFGRQSVVVGGGRTGGVTGAGNEASDNIAASDWSFVGGGQANRAGLVAAPAGTRLSTVAGGHRNVASGLMSTAVGGGCNLAQGSGAAVVGGGSLDETVPCAFGNSASGDQSFVGAGFSNVASGPRSIVGGGVSNTASGERSAVVGGESNIASGSYAFVGGGQLNTASGAYSVALGNRARTHQSGNPSAAHNGAFVFADTVGGDFFSAGSNTFNVRAGGGVFLSPTTRLRFGLTDGQSISLLGDPAVSGNSRGIGVQDNAMYFRVDGGTGTGGFAWYRGGVHATPVFESGSGGLTLMTLDRTGSLSATGSMNATAFNTTSDRGAKADIVAVSVQELLRRVLALPIATWRFKGDESGTRHIGPMAQDFRRLVGVGGDGRRINLADAQGVALAAIQGLNAKLEARGVQLERENRALRERVAQGERERAAERERLEVELRELRVELRALARGASAR